MTLATVCNIPVYDNKNNVARTGNVLWAVNLCTKEKYQLVMINTTAMDMMKNGYIRPNHVFA